MNVQTYSQQGLDVYTVLLHICPENMIYLTLIINDALETCTRYTHASSNNCTFTEIRSLAQHRLVLAEAMKHTAAD